MEKLRERVDAMREEQEKLLQATEDEQMLVEVHSPLPQRAAKEEDKFPMLIDLVGDSRTEQTTPMSSNPVSHDDLLGLTPVEASNDAALLPQSDILQPEVLTQSQELF